MDNKNIIGIADMKMAQTTGTLITYALGSCIGICLYDQRIKLGALIHIMLPLNMETGRTGTMKYADTAIRETLRQMEAKGGSKARITAKIAGGAKMFEIVSAVKEGYDNGEDVGGTIARTLLFDVATGSACVRCHGRPDLIL